MAMSCGMSANEIIAELPKLTDEDLRRVDEQLHKLLHPDEESTSGQEPIGKLLLKFAGRAEGLPADYSENLDHYLYGKAKRK
jgi:hypothetical protein